MPEGVMSAATGAVIDSAGLFDNPDEEPAADPARAPKGWTWSRTKKAWVPRVRVAPGAAPLESSPGPAEGRAAAPGPGDQAGRDPDPGWFAPAETKPAAGGRSSVQLSFDDIPQQVKDDIAGFAGLVGAPVLAMLQAADPYCGSALAQNFEPIIDATLPLLCRSQKVVAYFTGDKSDWLLWGKLAMALAPVGRAIYEHHIVRSVQVVRDPATGMVDFVHRGRGGSEHGEHLQPQPQAEFNYAA